MLPYHDEGDSDVRTNPVGRWEKSSAAEANNLPERVLYPRGGRDRLDDNLVGTSRKRSADQGGTEPMGPPW